MGKISKNDIIYFKDSPGLIQVKAKVSKVMEFNLSQKLIKNILVKYGKKIGFENINIIFNQLKNKKYCILIFLTNVEKIKPFNIDKKGFGNMCSWLTLKDISSIKK